MPSTRSQVVPPAFLAALVVALAVAPVAPRPARAQRPAELAVGAPVLVVARDAPRSSPAWRLAPGPRGVRGNVLRLTADTVYVGAPGEPAGAIRAIPRAAVRELYVRAGRASRAGQVLRGVATGALVFGAGEALTGAVSGGARRGPVLTAAGAGAAVGLVFGAARPLDRWRPAHL